MNCAGIWACQRFERARNGSIATHMSKTVAIIGAGHAGVQAAASLREEGFDGEVVLISAEPDLPYHKPPLSKAFIKDPAATPQLLRGEVFYSGHNIKLELGSVVDRIDAAARRIIFSGGRQLGYDSLILATGSRPRILNESQNLHGVMVLRTLDDARRMRDVAASISDVLVVGAGFIGLEAAATLAAAGRRVTVIEAQDRPLGRAVAPLIAAHVRQRLEAMGVRVLTGAKLDTLRGDAGQVSGALLAGGEEIAAQLVVVGIGVTPEVSLAEQMDLELGNGVRVDGSMHTSVDGVLAVGDCVNFRHWMTGGHVRLESVQNATDQAKLAAKTIVGQNAQYTAVPWFWSDIGDMKLQMVGLPGRSDRQVMVGAPEDNRFSVYHFSQDRLTAIETVNRPADHMLGRKMLATNYSPSPEALASNPEGLKSAFAEWQALNGS